MRRRPLRRPRRSPSRPSRRVRRSRARRRSTSMFELMFCATFTLLPDYLYRRYGQGKRLGREITLYSVWFELRWGLVGCVMLTVGLITVVFYNHPSTTNVTSFFRTIPILPESVGRVSQVYVGTSDT